MGKRSKGCSYRCRERGIEKEEGGRNGEKSCERDVFVFGLHGYILCMSLILQKILW